MEARSIRKGIVALAVLALPALLVPLPAQAFERAMAIDGPNGERYYTYAHGGEFPTGHALEVWKESNGLLKCSVPAGPPIGHATTPSGQSGLQVKTTVCGGKTYPPDTRVQ